MGGAGDDRYIVALNQTIVGEASAGGTDSVYPYAPRFVVTSYVETVYLMLGAGGVAAGRVDNTVHGNDLDNRIYGQAGDDTLHGNDGDGLLRGGAGDNVYLVDNTATLAGEAFGQGADAVYSSADTFAIYSYVETVFLLVGARDVRASHGDNTI